LSGFSAINRVGSDYKHDDRLRRVQFDNQDHFAIDGERLVAVEGSPGADGTIYRTVHDTFSRVVSRTSDPAKGPDSFEVRTRDGRVLIYGKGELDLRNTATACAFDGVARAWMLSEVRDRHGNVMHIEYWNFGYCDATMETTEILPWRVWYTTNKVAEASLFATRMVEFGYEDHPDPREGYFAGLEQENRHLPSPRAAVAIGVVSPVARPGGPAEVRGESLCL
jgi:hypothetical protein